MEHDVSEQRPGEDDARRKKSLCACAPDEHAPSSPSHSPLRIKVTPAKQAILALTLGLPPILVHSIPMSANTVPKKPRQTAEIISPLHAWM